MTRLWMIAALTLWLALIAYTALVIRDHGLGLVPIFFDDIGRGGWPGQFNFDFALMLFASASWTWWRNRIHAYAPVLALLALCLGASFLLPYIAWLIVRYKGDVAGALTGRSFHSS